MCVRLSPERFAFTGSCLSCSAVPWSVPKWGSGFSSCCDRESPHHRRNRWPPVPLTWWCKTESSFNTAALAVGWSADQTWTHNHWGVQRDNQSEINEAAGHLDGDQQEMHEGYRAYVLRGGWGAIASPTIACLILNNSKIRSDYFRDRRMPTHSDLWKKEWEIL